MLETATIVSEKCCLLLCSQAPSQLLFLYSPGPFAQESYIVDWLGLVTSISHQETLPLPDMLTDKANMRRFCY